MNNSLLTSVENHTFNGLSDLEVLHLEGNSLRQLQGDEFHGLKRLRELYLHDNAISRVNNATFRDLENLQVLSLQGNRITDFPVWRLSLNPLISRLALSRNPWSCECRFLNNYQRWLTNYGAKVVDANAISCRGNDAEQSVLHFRCPILVRDDDEEEETSLSATIQQKDLSLHATDASDGNVDVESRQQEHVFHDFLPIFLGVLSAVVLVVIIMIAVFVYRDEMRLWLYSKYGVRFFHRIDGMGSNTSSASGIVREETDALFDAFVALYAKDDAFVRQMLAPGLELTSGTSTTPSQPLLDHQLLLPGSASSQSLQRSQQQSRYKLCLFYRDLPVHHPAYQLSDTIVQASEAARRTVLVLSDHLIKSEWTRFDFKSGLHQALNGRKNKKRLVVIVLGDVASRKDLDPDLRLYLKTGVILHWGDKLFWEKLRYAFPDLQQQQKAQQRRLQQQQQLQQQAQQHMMSAFSPDNDSFRYETYRHVNQNHYHQPHTLQQHSTAHHVHQHSHTLSMGGGSSTYQSVSTPDEQDSTTRTMTIHI